MRSRLWQMWVVPGWARLGQMSLDNQVRLYRYSYYPRRDLLEQAHLCCCTVWPLVLSFSLSSLRRRELQHNGKGHMLCGQPSLDLSPALTLSSQPCDLCELCSLYASNFCFIKWACWCSLHRLECIWFLLANISCRDIKDTTWHHRSKIPQQLVSTNYKKS